MAKSHRSAPRGGHPLRAACMRRPMRRGARGLTPRRGSIPSPARNPECSACPPTTAHSLPARSSPTTTKRRHMPAGAARLGTRLAHMLRLAQRQCSATHPSTAVWHHHRVSGAPTTNLRSTRHRTGCRPAADSGVFTTNWQHRTTRPGSATWRRRRAPGAQATNSRCTRRQVGPRSTAGRRRTAWLGKFFRAAGSIRRRRVWRRTLEAPRTSSQTPQWRNTRAR
mmetsp:Transcript_35588/g.88943  ORF Transcript_35588/g.88943 Transcript_35588/m.88943 type:complete len:224 (-) Transcript_35588:205-876(-)